MTRPAVGAVLVFLALAAGACTGSAPERASSASGRSLTGSLTVSAASSLTEALTEIGDGFEALHPTADVTFSFASSATLAAQIREGAPADVFASADEATMDALVADDFIDGAPEVFAGNELVIVTRPGNPSDVSEPSDLVRVGVVALCVDTAPCGRLSADVLARAGVALDPGRVTESADARATLGAVTHGDADAALVYATDARAAGDGVETVPLARTVAVGTDYPIGVVATTTAPGVAEAFVAHVTSPAGRAVLADHGFLTP